MNTKRIHVAVTPTLLPAPGSEAGDFLVVVIDLLRASTSIIRGLMAGARCVIPVVDRDAVIALKRELSVLPTPHGQRAIVTAGERGGLKIEEFDMGNSPREFASDRVRDAVIIMSTTNGTGAIDIGRRFGHVIIGGLNNAGLVARMIARDDRDVILLCAGNDGGFSMDDFVAAGGIIESLGRCGRPYEVDDAGQSALEMFMLLREDLARRLGETDHGRRLRAIGAGQDIPLCAMIDIEGAVVPELVDDALTIIRSNDR
jgi:2-phosphosulfolactate phosphatase